jgi:hypothetical protein
MLPKPGRFSLGVGGFADEPPNAKLPKFPIGDIVALAGPGPQGEAGPLPSALPTVLARINPPKGRVDFVSSARSSAPSFESLNLRLKNGDSSLENRLPTGEAKLESAVCCRRVLGLLDEAGEESPKVLEPCEIDVLRPFAPCALGSLCVFCGGGFMVELTSPEKI